jgi:hypothetical protein
MRKKVRTTTPPYASMAGATLMTKTYGLDPVMAGPPELCDLPAS